MQDYANLWKFFGREQDPLDTTVIRQTVEGKRVLITGAAGYIGSALARSIAQFPQHMSLLDIAESGLHGLASDLDLSTSVSHDLIVGDVCDAALLADLFERLRPQVVLHAAACKHVVLMEGNPFAAARTNVLGTRRIVQAASTFESEKLIVISTDKAVAPMSIMGATKRIAELIVSANRAATQMCAVRLGNVLGSTGSVVPILKRQIAQGGPITITDAACTRFFISIDEAIQHLLSALLLDGPSRILVSEVDKAYRITDLARFLLKDSNCDHQEIEYRFIGLGPGEKISERMTTDEEVLVTTEVLGLREVLPGPGPSMTQLTAAIEEIEAAFNPRDLDRLLRAVCNIVPDYVPSAHLQRMAVECAGRSTL